MGARVTPGLAAQRLGCALALAVLVSSCTNASGVSCGSGLMPADQFGRHTIVQGVAGNVWEWVGDFQLHGVADQSCYSITPVRRTLLIYPAIPTSAVFGYSSLSRGFLDSIPAQPIDSVSSDSTGFFQLPLAVGGYSVIVRERSQYYVNGGTFDANYFSFVRVSQTTVSRMPVNITYRALF